MKSFHRLPSVTGINFWQSVKTLLFNSEVLFLQNISSTYFKAFAHFVIISVVSFRKNSNSKLPPVAKSNSFLFGVWIDLNCLKCKMSTVLNWQLNLLNHLGNYKIYYISYFINMPFSPFILSWCQCRIQTLDLRIVS